MTIFDYLAGMAALTAGAVAAVSGFGVGSILTPVLSIRLGTQLAVAAVSLPHLAATFVRFWMLRRDVNRRVLIGFGITSAAGGLCGALLQSVVSSVALTHIFAGLLIFAGLSSITGYSKRMRFGRVVAWVAGTISGVLGGLVGNQGGIRSAALLGFSLERHAFVATATAIGLFVDCARVPVYLATSTPGLIDNWKLIALCTAGALAGTFLGTSVLKRIPEEAFSRVVGALILGLGVWMLIKGMLDVS